MNLQTLLRLTTIWFVPQVNQSVIKDALSATIDDAINGANDDVLVSPNLVLLFW